MGGSAERQSKNPLTVVFPLYKSLFLKRIILKQIFFFPDDALEQKNANIQPGQTEQDMVMAKGHIFLVNELLEFFLEEQ